MTLIVAPNEQGLIRVFAVNRPASDVAQAIVASGAAGLAADLLKCEIAQSGLEFVAVADLAGIGLSGYLADGYAVPPDQLNAARSKLDALDGYVLLLFSSAFEGTGKTLAPGPDVTLIGTFGETQADMTARALKSEAAKAYSGTPRQTSVAPSGKRAGGSLMVAATIVLAGLVLWWALS
ncbi:MAG: hypothetical protein WBB25_22490 [Sulfitobacter sp.]